MVIMLPLSKVGEIKKQELLEKNYTTLKAA